VTPPCRTAPSTIHPGYCSARLCIMESLTLQVHTKMVPRSQMASPSATVQSEFEYVFAPPSNAKLLRPVQLWAIGLPAEYPGAGLASKYGDTLVPFAAG